MQIYIGWSGWSCYSDLGPMYLIVKIDGEDEVNETNESNNTNDVLLGRSAYNGATWQQTQNLSSNAGRPLSRLPSSLHNC